ncbi:WD40 domain-containing protein [Micromonospora sp. NPDC003197]
MALGGYRLGIDFGTSSTVAMLAGLDSRAKPLLFDASPLLSSGVFVRPGTGPLLTGVDAERGASTYPAGFEANPKRRIDDGVIWLAEREVAVTEAIAAVLSRVAVEAVRVGGGPPDAVLVTHPAGWSRTRLGVLAAAAQRAQLGECGFVAEPVAAAAYFASVLGRDLPVGRSLVVYDLGAGTCDVSIVRRVGGGLEVLATAGLDDVGGLDLDAAIVAHVRSLTATNTDAWGRLEWPQTPTDLRAQQLLWRDARIAKEQLSRHATAELHVPLVETVVHVTRDEFETMARPHLDRTVDLTAALLRDIGVSRGHIAGVFLVGGSSRVPLVASLLHRALRIAPTALDSPELVVAEGALHVPAITHAPTRPVPATPAIPTPPVLAPTGLAVAPATPTLPAPPPPAETSTFGDNAHHIKRPTAAGVIPRAVKAGDTGVATTPVRRSRWLSRIRRSKAVIGGAIALVLAIVFAIGLWASLGSRPDRTLTGHTDVVTSVAFSLDGKTLATGSRDMTVRLWDVATGKSAAALTGHTESVESVAFSPDGKILASGSGDKTVRLWDVASGATTATLTGHNGWITSVAFSPDGRTLATGNGDDTVRLWEVASGRTTAILTDDGDLDDDGWVSSVAFSPDGKLLATAGNDDTVRLWDVATRRTTRILTGHSASVESVVFSPDGKTLATAGSDGTMRLWDAATGTATATLTGHSASVESVAFSPDGKTLATAGSDETVRLWDAATGGNSATIGHGGPVIGVVFSPDGKTLATSGGDETVRLWNVDSRRWWRF